MRAQTHLLKGACAEGTEPLIRSVLGAWTQPEDEMDVVVVGGKPGGKSQRLEMGWEVGDTGGYHRKQGQDPLRPARSSVGRSQPGGWEDVWTT